MDQLNQLNQLNHNINNLLNRVIRVDGEDQLIGQARDIAVIMQRYLREQTQILGETTPIVKSPKISTKQ